MRNVMTWEYKNKNGQVVGHVSRFESDNNLDGSKSRKKIIPYFEDDGKAGIPDDFPASNRIFGLESIKDKSKVMFVVEGEKCAYALQTLGFQAVTSLGGAQNSHLADWGELEGVQQVCLCPDSDEMGVKYIYGVYKAISKLETTPKISIVKLPDLPDKGDICDYLKRMPELSDWNEMDSLENHLQQRMFYERLQETFKTSQLRVPAEWGFITTKSKLKAIDVNNFKRLGLPKRRELLAPWLLEASINMVFANRGLGKTFFCLSSALAIVNGERFLNYEAKEAFPALYLDGEMQASLMQERFESLTGGKDTRKPLQIFTPDLQELDEIPDLSTISGQKLIDELIKDIGAKVIFIDNISTFMRTGSENDAESWSTVQPWLIKHRKYGRAIILIHHTNKEGGARGTHKKEDVMDAIIQLKRPDDFVDGQDETRLTVSFTKARHLYGEQTQELEATLKSEDDYLIWECKVAGGKFNEAVRLLKEKQLSQNDIAETLEITKGTVSKWKQRAIEQGLI